MSDMLLSEAIKALCIATRADGRSPRTVQSYREKLSYLLTFLGDVPIEGITVNDLRGWVADMYDRETIYVNHHTHQEQAQGLSEFTISSRVRHMKRLFNWCAAEGIITSNPSKRIKTPRPKRDAPKEVSKKNVLALLATAAGDTLTDLRDRAIMFFLIDTGCRAGGLCGLKLDGLDLDAKLAKVTEKGGKTRFVMFNPPTEEALKAWLKVRPKGNDWVFVSLGGHREGEALTPSGVLQMLKRRAKRAGIKGRVNTHSWRHAFAKLYLTDGGDVSVLSRILGHSDVRTTVDFYAVYCIEELQRKHQQHSPVSQMFGGKKDGEDEDVQQES